MRRTATRRPIRLTEAKLRQIIRETIEEELIQEGAMLEKLKQPAIAAATALGLALTPATIDSMIHAMHRAAESVDTKQVHSDYIERSGDGADKLNRAKHIEVSRNPTLTRGQEIAKKSAINKRIKELRAAGYTDKEIEELLKSSLKPDMYEG